MKTHSHGIPTRRTASGEEIDTRPMYVEEWLDSLPYLDFKKTSRLLCEATRATNAQSLKASQRLELVELYNRPYRYYIDSQIRTGAQHTLQSIETMQDQTGMLKVIAVNLAYACKLAAEEPLKQKTLWRRTKPPLPALLGSLNYLSHALIFSFLEYAPTPKNVWKELHFIYSFAEGLEQQHALLLPVGGDPEKDQTSVAAAYTRIVMASVSDPHHLPFGGIWELYEQLRSWGEYVKIRDFAKPEDAAGRFAVDLDSDERPLPAAKLKTAPENPARWRLFDATALGALVEDQLREISSGRALDARSRLSPYFAKSVLKHVARAYGPVPERNAEREGRQGKLNLARGLNAIYFFLNGEREFRYVADEEDAEAPEITPGADYKVENWNLVDQSRGGFAVIKSDKPDYPLRVGELVAVTVRAAESVSYRKWRIGIVRWMMIRPGQSYRIGVELLPAVAVPAAVRALGGSREDTRFRRGLLVGAAVQGEASLITDRGLHITGRELDLRLPDGSASFSAGRLIEASVAFEHFHVTRK